ncbi:hypothetical protein ACFU8Q_01840 [Streptomyces sp. NPDC057543]|uniref:hypothetical protein n=1 Tax=Streptomyces sp. NPDC057543 TaxID=3346163 RepID=UPI0036836AE2
MLVEDMPDGIDGRAQDLCCVLNGVVAFSDDLVQVGQVDVRRVGSGKGQSGQQSGGRLPGHRLVVDVVRRQEAESLKE